MEIRIVNMVETDVSGRITSLGYSVGHVKAIWSPNSAEQVMRGIKEKNIVYLAEDPVTHELHRIEVKPGFHGEYLSVGAGWQGITPLNRLKKLNHS
ncbi:hypothetical protein I6E68_05925 [Salinibacterium sp. NSLL150]|uniref:hypothetical protein n=1 Tax=unclassified Salinibacterium TaxID=2632331 RepID=UPI0018CDC380|nr:MULTISPECIES: hypothetical protein [unclassified Salinibacterium]MBH0098678.1 hypothetical protein [Salinibacterium sp. NSLL35]MBH0101433.1 hypothetical protein [Salinibacterium sp. NSLL150]MBH0104192.1 hypothetical protein [Salinibacterium sp. NSLL16]MBH0106953.1 hypothetical protein [Salinibacterium sp. NSLL17]